MEDSRVLRALMDSLEPIIDSEPDFVPTEQVGSDPMVCLKSIMGSLNVILDSIKNEQNIEEITSGLHNLSEQFKELADSLGNLEECHGTEGMGPTLVNKDGKELQVYNEPDGESYPQRNGFVG